MSPAAGGNSTVSSRNDTAVASSTTARCKSAGSLLLPQTTHVLASLLNL
jgi:hypothetical protein